MFYTAREITDRMVKELKKKFKKLSDKERARVLASFFKTDKGQYGEGDIFIGIRNPDLKVLAKEYKDLSFSKLKKLLKSKIHEERCLALFILVKRYPKEKKKTVDFYLENLKGVNNWDLVDASAYKILGDYLIDKDKKILYRLAKSDNLWEKRVAIISTLAFIREGEFKDCLAIAEILLKDKHDLIHKAVGWMLREVGKRDLRTEERFLKKHYQNMPRTMLRYAIERFEEQKRRVYLKGEI